MGCRPSKQATSKVRAVNESLCLCSPRKVRKNHKCSSSSAKSAAMGSKKHSLSSGHKPRTMDVASMDFPAFSTTTAVYRKSASKTSKITLRLSCDGSTLEIEQCDYDLEKAYGDLTPTPRPWHSAPNLTHLKDKKTRLFREKPMKHSKSTWSPSVSSTVSGFLAMRVPAVINAVENQPSSKSFAVSRPSSNDSQADCGSSNERCNTGKTPLLRTGCKLNSTFGYKNPSDFTRNPDGDQGTYTSDNDYSQQRLNNMGNSSSNNFDSRVHPHDMGKTTKFKTRTQHHETREDSDLSSEFEHIPVNLITSFGPPLPSEKSYRFTDSNHNQFRLRDCYMQDNKTKLDATFATQHFRSFACSQPESLGTQNIAGVYGINDFSPMYTSRDNSPVSGDSQIDSNSILTFVALGCPVPNETSNCLYSSDDDDAVGLFTPRHEVTCLPDSLHNDVVDIGAMNSTRDVFPRELCMPARNRFGDLWGSRYGQENNNLIALKAMGSLQDSSRRCNGFTNSTKLTSCISSIVKKDSKQEWIDGELRLVKSDDTDVDRCSGWTSECWSNVKFPVMKTHIPASAVLRGLEETTALDQVTNSNGVLSSYNREITDLARETRRVCRSEDSSAWKSNHMTDGDLINSAAVNVESWKVVSVDNTLADDNTTSVTPIGTAPINAEFVSLGSSDEKSIDGKLERINSVDMESVNVNLEIKDFQLKKDNEIFPNTKHLHRESQLMFLAKNSERISSPTLQNEHNNSCSLSFIDPIPPPHYCGAIANSEVNSGLPLNHYASLDFHEELEIDTSKNAIDSHKADYLMELLISDTSNTMKLDKKSILYSDFENFMENGNYSLTESSESESGLMWFKEYSLLSHATESHTLESLQTTVVATNINFVKMNILKKNLSSLDPSKDSKYTKVTSPVSVANMSANILFTHSNIIEEDFVPAKCTKASDQRDNILFKHNYCKSRMFDHLTLNSPYSDVHSLGNCTNLKSGQERSTREVNNYLNETTKREALQVGELPHRSGIMSCDEDTTSSIIQTCLCPLAFSPNQAELDFNGESESMNASSELPHSTYYCERNLNEKNIDPPEITYLDLGGNSPAFLALPSSLNQTQLVHSSQDSSKCQVEPFLCKTSPQENECARYNGGHLGLDSIYIETNDFSKTCDCDCLGHKDCPCYLNTSISQTGSHILSRSAVELNSDLTSQPLEVRLKNLTHAAMDNDLDLNSYELIKNSDTECHTEPFNSKRNNYCNEHFLHCSNGLYIDTVGNCNPDHYMDCSNAGYTIDSMEHFNTDVYKDTKNQGQTDPDNERAYQRIKSVDDNGERNSYYENCLGQNNSRETKQEDEYVYISAPRFMCDNSFRAKPDTFTDETLDAITPKRNHHINDKRSDKLTHTSRSSIHKQEMLASTRDGHLVDNDACMRQTHTNLIFQQEYACYRPFSETNHSESMPKNNVLSLVRYFEKVPFINNNAK